MLILKILTIEIQELVALYSIPIRKIGLYMEAAAETQVVVRSGVGKLYLYRFRRRAVISGLMRSRNKRRIESAIHNSLTIIAKFDVRACLGLYRCLRRISLWALIDCQSTGVFFL